MKTRMLFIVAVLFSVNAFSQITPLWLRRPAISPDGKTIAFGYKGHLYTVSASGGTAQLLTVSNAQDMAPVWSHDGKSIAFASDRFGNFDVFIMPAKGGTPKRLTYFSVSDFPTDFTPDDKGVLFTSSRNAPAKSVRFSSGLFPNLYTVSVMGGRPELVSAAGMATAHYNNNGSSIVFEDIKGYEDPMRKHATSAVTRDIWIMNVGDRTYKKISTYNGEDREPVFGSDDKTVYYLSEQKGAQNLFAKNIGGGASDDQQLTFFKDNPVRNLSRSSDNTLCFTWTGEIYTLAKGEKEPRKVAIQIDNDGGSDIPKSVSVNGDIREFAVSPNGKEVAFVTRGEVFVTAVEDGETKRITNTPQQERMIEWAPDGRSLIYAAERGNSWDIYKTSIVRKDEPYFYASTVLKEEPVIAGEKDEYQPKYSPDGKEIAYIEERNTLKVYNIASKKTVTLLPTGHNYSYSDGDWDFNWSPDSKWVICDDEQGYFASSNTALIKADGTGEIKYPVNSGFGEGNSKWAMNGKMLTWESSKLGRKSLASQGDAEVDVYGVFFDKKAYEQFLLSKEDYALLKERESHPDTLNKNTDTTAKKNTAKKDTAKKDTTVKPLQIDLNDLDNRQVRLTINSCSISDYALTKDGDKLYYLAAFENGFNLWQTETRTHDTKILAQFNGTRSGLILSKDEKSLFASSGGRLMKIDAATGKISPIAISSDMNLDAAKERAYVFEHAWRQVKKKLYAPNLNNVDWDKYKTTYEKFLPHINNNYDFQDLLSEMLGELNVSHSGGRYYPNNKDGDKTASLGLLYDETYKGKGLKVTEVIAGGPIDAAKIVVKQGDILESIDGKAITDSVDWSVFLNRKAGKNTLLSFNSGGTSKEVVIRPITLAKESDLMYNRWIKNMADMVDKLSGGKIGYVHVQGMNDESFRETFDKVMGKNREKKALIVDTRFNGGGWLHDDLATFLTGKNYLKFAPQGNVLKGGEPMNRWQKPSCVLMSEGNYSDAFIFPYIYKELGVGKLIGMPVAGTGTAVWWERQIDPTLIFGIPMVATIGKENRPTEGLQVEPDIRVPLPYEDFLNGKDDQLEAAVKEMLSESGK